MYRHTPGPNIGAAMVQMPRYDGSEAVSVYKERFGRIAAGLQLDEIDRQRLRRQFSDRTA